MKYKLIFCLTSATLLISCDASKGMKGASSRGSQNNSDLKNIIWNASEENSEYFQYYKQNTQTTVGELPPGVSPTGESLPGSNNQFSQPTSEELNKPFFVSNMETAFGDKKGNSPEGKNGSESSGKFSTDAFENGDASSGGGSVFAGKIVGGDNTSGTTDEQIKQNSKNTSSSNGQVIGTLIGTLPDIFDALGKLKGSSSGSTSGGSSSGSPTSGSSSDGTSSGSPTSGSSSDGTSSGSPTSGSSSDGTSSGSPTSGSSSDGTSSGSPTSGSSSDGTSSGSPTSGSSSDGTSSGSPTSGSSNSGSSSDGSSSSGDGSSSSVDPSVGSTGGSGNTNNSDNPFGDITFGSSDGDGSSSGGSNNSSGDGSTLGGGSSDGNGFPSNGDGSSMGGDDSSNNPNDPDSARNGDPNDPNNPNDPDSARNGDPNDPNKPTETIFLHVAQLKYEAWWKNCMRVRVLDPQNRELDKAWIGCNKDSSTEGKTVVLNALKKPSCNKIEIEMSTFIIKSSGAQECIRRKDEPGFICGRPQDYDRNPSMLRTSTNYSQFFKIYDMRNLTQLDSKIDLNKVNIGGMSTLQNIARQKERDSVRMILGFFEDQPSLSGEGIDFNDFIFDLQGQNVNFTISGSSLKCSL